MATVPSIQFTQDQARSITGVSAETLRHWRKNVPYLAEKTGKSARFSFPDLVGIAVVGEFIRVFGVSIGQIKAGADTLFRTLNNTKVTALLNAFVVLGTASAQLCEADEVLRFKGLGPVLMIECGPLIESMRTHLLTGIGTEQQPSLPFPPHAVSR